MIATPRQARPLGSGSPRQAPLTGAKPSQTARGVQKPLGGRKTAQAPQGAAFRGQASGNTLGEINQIGLGSDMPFRQGQPSPQVGAPLAGGQHMQPKQISPEQKPMSPPMELADDNALRLAPPAEIVGQIPHVPGRVKDIPSVLGMLAGQGAG